MNDGFGPVSARTLLAKRLTDIRPSSLPAIDWSAALNAALMLPAGALLSLALHPLLARTAAPTSVDVLVAWQPSTPSSAGSHFMLGVVLCFLLATWAAMRRPLPVPRAGFATTVAMLTIFAALVLASVSLLCQIVVYEQKSVWPAWLGLVAYAAFLGWYGRTFRDGSAEGTDAGAFFPAATGVPASGPGYLGDACAVAAIFVAFWPYSGDALLNHWDLKNPHVISYLFGPAQLSQVPGNLPNVNFFSQYSIGVPYLFSWALGSDVVEVVRRYLYGMTAAVILYSAAYYFLLSRLCASRFWGFVFTLLMMALLANALFWSEPSSAPIRFLLFPVCALVLLRFGLDGAALAVVAGILAALSVMNNTETGVHTTLAFASVILVSAPSWRQFGHHLALLVATTIAGVAALCVLCYGPGSFSMAFLVGNLKPLVVYSVVGFGNYPLPWDFKHWTWMQSLVMPGLATLVIALLYYKTWTRRTLSHAEEALVFCSAFGLLLLVKFMYRSFMALGHVNSGPLIVVLAFWFVFSLRKVIELRRLPSGAATAGAFVLSLAIFVTFLHTFRENTPGRDIKFATTWLSYPSIFNRVVGVAPDPSQGESFAQRAATLVNDIDVALIRRYSQASKPVWIYADEDWAYLLRAERKPATTVLPIPHILMGSDLDNLKAKFASDEPLYLFVEKRHEPLLLSGQAAAVFPGFASRYAPVETGKNLAVYRRKAD